MQKKLNKRKIIINVIVVTAVTLFAVYYLTKSEIVSMQSLKTIKWWNYFLVLICFFACFALLSCVDYFIYRSFTNSMPYGKCFVNTLSGNLGSGVTPFKSAHFPLMAYYQYNSGVPVKDTFTGLVKCQIIYSVTSLAVYMFIVSFLAIGGYTIEFYETTVALWLVVSLGLIFHVVVFTAIVVLSYNSVLQKKALTLWASFLFKIKKINDKDVFVNEKAVKLQTFREQMNIIGKNIKNFIFPVIAYGVFMLLSGSMQYLSYMFISGAPFTFSQLFTFYTLNLASAYITNIVPVPGGVGTSEVLFTLVFVSVIPDNIMGSVLLLWRIGTYYLAIIFELIVFVLFIFIKKRSKTKENVNIN